MFFNTAPFDLYRFDFFCNERLVVGGPANVSDFWKA